MNATTMLRIVEEKRLSVNAYALLNEAGDLTVIQDVSVPESEQQYICLTALGVQALLELLNENE